MVLDHTKVVYTAEDEQGFTFRRFPRFPLYNQPDNESQTFSHV